MAIIATGIAGLDQILRGGYPAGRPTVVLGASGTGKSMIALMFAASAVAKGRSVVYGTFDEAPEHLRSYLKAWGLPSDFRILDFRPDPTMQLAGTHIELGGLTVRVEHALAQSGADILVLDAIDALLDSFGDQASIRRDLVQLMEWCRGRDITLLATAGVGPGYQPSTGVIDYAADCTILLSQRMDTGLMTRTMRVLKRRGSGHGTNEYPFLIDDRGVSVMPVTDTAMDGPAPRRRLSTGVHGLDRMLGGRGVWEGSTVMLSGQSGTGKSILAMTMADNACAAGRSVLYVSFEESPRQIVRDVRSVGLDIKKHLESGRLRILSQRPVEAGQEEHVIRLIRQADETRPEIIVIDPISGLVEQSGSRDFKNVVVRLCHHFKAHGVTTILTELLPDSSGNVSGLSVSSLIDTWIRIERNIVGDRLVRQIRVHKSRGAATSDRIREFQITGRGIVIRPLAAAALPGKRPAANGHRAADAASSWQEDGA